MVLDSSAIVAVYLKEPNYERFLEAMDKAPVLLMGAPTLLETIMVLTSRLRQDARPLMAAFNRRLQIEIVTFNEQHLDAATDAFLRFGRGRHPAGLNFGDCLSYAVAAVSNLPLLFTGEDFGRTDIKRASF